MHPGQTIFQGKTKKGLEIMIRFPCPRDTKLLMDFINTVSQEQTFIRLQGEQVSFEEEEKYVKGLILGMEKQTVFKLMAFDKEKFIGAADITMKDKIEKHVGVFGITVAKEYRKLGVGSTLIELVLSEAPKYLPDLKIIELGVFGNNPIAQNLYKKYGFIPFGILSEGIVYKNQYIDHVLMYKKIA